MLRKVSALLTLAFVTAGALIALALPASAAGYPPIVTTTTTEPAAPSKLAFTGADSTPLLVIALVAITVGAVLVVAVRRRSSVQSRRSA